jgi:hypothetical protein
VIRARHIRSRYIEHRAIDAGYEGQALPVRPNSRLVLMACGPVRCIHRGVRLIKCTYESTATAFVIADRDADVLPVLRGTRGGVLGRPSRLSDLRLRVRPATEPAIHEPVCSSQLEPLSIQNATTSCPQQRDSVSALSRHRRANVGPTDHMRLRPRPYCGDMRSRLRESLAVPTDRLPFIVAT